MPREVTTLRLLALAYAKGKLTRSEYLGKRGQQLSALEFDQTQPHFDDSDTLLTTVSQEISFLKDAKIRYFEGSGDALSVARMRARAGGPSADGHGGGREALSTNRLIIIACTVVALGVLLQLLGLYLSDRQEETQSQSLEEIFAQSKVEIAKELNLKPAEEEKILSQEDYDQLASEILLGQALARLADIDLETLGVKDASEVLKMVGGADEAQRKIIANTSWLDKVIVVLGEYSDRLDSSLGPGATDPRVAKMSAGQKRELAQRRTIFLKLYGDLADMQYEFSEQ